MFIPVSLRTFPSRKGTKQGSHWWVSAVVGFVGGIRLKPVGGAQERQRMELIEPG